MVVRSRVWLGQPDFKHHIITDQILMNKTLMNQILTEYHKLHFVYNYIK